MDSSNNQALIIYVPRKKSRLAHFKEQFSLLNSRLTFLFGTEKRILLLMLLTYTVSMFLALCFCLCNTSLALVLYLFSIKYKHFILISFVLLAISGFSLFGKFIAIFQNIIYGLSFGLLYYQNAFNFSENFNILKFFFVLVLISICVLLLNTKVFCFSSRRNFVTYNFRDFINFTLTSSFYIALISYLIYFL